MRFLSAAAVLLLLAVSFHSSAKPADAALELRSATAQNLFPDGVRFTALVASDATVNNARLIFRVLPDGNNVAVRAQCTTGNPTNCAATVGASADSYIVPGAIIVYHWEIEDSAGGRAQSAEDRVTYDDTRFRWEAVTVGGLTAHYYFGDDATLQAVLKAAQETIDRMSALVQTTVDFPVHIWIYNTARDMQPAIQTRTGGATNNVQTLGEVSASDTALVSRDTEFLNIVRHEIAHIVTRRATRGNITEIPVWVNEGLSTWIQNRLLASEQQALDTAIRLDRALPISRLNTAARANADQVSLFYAESGSIVSFMIQTYGDAKFGQFVHGMARDTADGAMKAAFGVDTLGLENAWRQSVGLKPNDPNAGGAQAAPTQRPAATPRTQTPAKEDGGNSTTTILLIVAALAGVGLIGGAGVYMYKTRETPAPPAPPSA
ncbi:MAG TPA: peptidase MA family metallohydrolase, partial [Dehalococcoidia bacterium]|nr:peptidase MA family metallohydrolase [Dehalococcoidia bacterium]